MNGSVRNGYHNFVGKPETKATVARYRCGWEDNINITLRGVGNGGMDWNEVTQDGDRRRVFVSTVMNIRVLQK
jgi:hypothetical protein